MQLLVSMRRRVDFITRVKQFFCFFHSFTTQIQERGAPDISKVLNEGTFRAFLHDSRMYCRKCGYVPQITLDSMKRGEEIDKQNITEKEKLTVYIINEIIRPVEL